MTLHDRVPGIGGAIGGLTGGLIVAAWHSHKRDHGDQDGKAG
ncbi:hypothetical protein [Actinokineospora sp. NBRC 105648]|nr:hypothetical protein [Actinokineospora sp. NBRC 105648]